MGLRLITSWDEASQELLLSIGRPLPASENTVVSCTVIAAHGSNVDAAQHLRCPGAVEHAYDASIAPFSFCLPCKTRDMILCSVSMQHVSLPAQLVLIYRAKQSIWFHARTPFCMSRSQLYWFTFFFPLRGNNVLVGTTIA